MTAPPTVSVVLPVYAVERYLQPCLDSLADQTFTDYEIVLVDDGSPDGSRAIADAAADSDSRILVVGQQNAGLGAARNTGVRHARGTYLTFVDSDDLVPRRALEFLVEAADSHAADIVTGAVQRFDGQRSWTPIWVPGCTAVAGCWTASVSSCRCCATSTPGTSCSADRSGSLGLWFREGVSYEDQPIVSQLLRRADRIDADSRGRLPLPRPRGPHLDQPAGRRHRRPA